MAISTSELDPANSAVYNHTPPDALPDIASLDLSKLLHATRVNGNRVPLDGETSRTIARFVTEKAEGVISDDEFEAAYSQAIGVMLGSIALQEQYGPTDLNERLFELYDVLDEQHPRTMELLGRVRNESNFSEEHRISLNKLCILVTSARFGHKI